ncbi:cuticle protein 19-like [Thrips palmi]|uniref:Cuticle protein 19-like n=1 Tax=Thrips palmi TaxID=161013 RepID=A0A6P8YMZ4_THRPL|nr:cuticle protein 19-like [Thrips palmi]
MGVLGPIGPIIIKPVIPPSGLPASASAAAASSDLHYDATLEHVGAGSRPEYAFAYGVQDPKSGNAQSHKEERDGDNVRGEYKVLEADGSVRTVTYTVDPKNGFQANVHQSDPSLADAYKAAAYKADAKHASQKAAIQAPDSPIVIIGASEPSGLSEAISEPISEPISETISETISEPISDPSSEYFSGSSYTDFEP